MKYQQTSSCSKCSGGAILINSGLIKFLNGASGPTSNNSMHCFCWSEPFLGAISSYLKIKYNNINDILNNTFYLITRIG